MTAREAFVTGARGAGTSYGIIFAHLWCNYLIGNRGEVTSYVICACYCLSELWLGIMCVTLLVKLCASIMCVTLSAKLFASIMCVTLSVKLFASTMCVTLLAKLFASIMCVTLLAKRFAYIMCLTLLAKVRGEQNSPKTIK